MYSKSIYILILLLLSSYFITIAQVDDEENTEEIVFDKNALSKLRVESNIIKTNPLVLLWSQIPFTGEARFLYEKMFHKNQSSMFGASYVFPNFLLVTLLKELQNQFNVKISSGGYRVQGMYKFYINNYDFEPEGVYLGLHASYYTISFNVKNRPNDFLKYHYLNGSIVGGYQREVLDYILLDVYAGIGIKNNSRVLGDASGITSSSNLNLGSVGFSNNLKYSLGINVGYLF